MTEKKGPPLQPGAQNKDPSTKAEPLEQERDGDFQVDLDLTQIQPLDPSAPVVQAPQAAPAEPAVLEATTHGELAERVRKLLSGEEGDMNFFIPAGLDEVNALELVRKSGEAPEEMAKGLNQLIEKAKLHLSAIQRMKDRVDGFEEAIEVNPDDVIEAEPIPLEGGGVGVAALADPAESGVAKEGSAKAKRPIQIPIPTPPSFSRSPMEGADVKGALQDEGVIRGKAVARASTPPPIPRISQAPAIGNRYLRLVQALPEDFRAQYVLALIDRIRESIADANVEASSPEENVEKIQAIKWVANEWRNDSGIPSEFIIKLISSIESNFLPALADRQLIALLDDKDYENFDRPLEELKNVIAERCQDRLDPEGRDQIRKIRSAFALGNESEGNQIMRQFFNSAESFYRMGKEGYQGLSQRNFMAEKSEPFPLVDYFRKHELKRMTEGKARLRILELGPGIGNDAMWWIRMAGVGQYLGIDANPKAVEISNRRIKDLFDSGLKGKTANVILGNFIENLEAIQRNANKNFQKNDRRFKTIVVGISVLHYLAVEEREFKRVLGIIRDIVAPTRGRLVMATKTPMSDTCKLHTKIRGEGGRVIGISRPEKIARAFMEREYLVRVLKEVGFDVENSTLLKQNMKGYDFPGLDEEFECVIAQPKDPKLGG